MARIEGGAFLKTLIFCPRMSTSSISNIGFSGAVTDMARTLPSKNGGDRGDHVTAIKKWFEEWRPSTVTMGAAAFPLLILFGLNAVDELDRAAFTLLLPEIRDHFDLT